MKQVKFQNRQNPNSQFDLIRIEEILTRKDLDHSPTELHRVEFFMLFFTEEGQGYHTIDFTDYKCTPGTLLTIRKNRVHKFSTTSKIKGWILLFTEEFIISYLEQIEAQKTLLLFNELLASPKIQLADIEFRQLKNVLERMLLEYHDINDSHSMGIIRSELHILISKLFRIKEKSGAINTDKKYLTEFVAFQNLVEAHASRTVKVKDYAEMMGVTTKTLNTVTRNILYTSAKEFIDEICTTQIKRLLINTDDSIKEIAYQCGFDETTNLYKYFRRQTQTTPEQFRRTHR